MGLGLLLAAIAVAPAPLGATSFTVPAASEVVATVTASCRECSWGRKGYEAAALRLEVDGRYSQHVLLTRGSEAAKYVVSLGRHDTGTHTVTAALDPAHTARHIREAAVDSIAVRVLAAGPAEERLLAHSPIVYARRNTIGRFSDVPLLMWVETDKTSEGTRLRYSVVFSNEDGGTPPDRLMATWGRLTDIEFVYGVDLDDAGGIQSAAYQAPEHKIEAFSGQREGNHPVLYVVTDNNMLRDRGPRTIRFAPAPEHLDLAGGSREVVMDRAPWTYRVSAEEARRERRVNPKAVPGDKVVPDPRRFVTLEACAPTQDATISFALAVRHDNGVRYLDSSAGLPKFRIGRKATEFPNGCFRGAVALPAGVSASQISALRVRAFTRLADDNERPLPRGAGTARLKSVNRLFVLDERDEPGRNLLEWRGDVALVPEGAPYEIPVDGKVARR